MPKKTIRPLSELIYCKACKTKMRYISERGKGKYICQTYSRSGKCIRNLISEEFIFGLLKEHFNTHEREFTLDNDFLKQEVGKIIINDGEVIIEFKNMPNLICNNNRLSHIYE